MSTHTPGPWFLCREGLNGKTYSIQTQEWGTTHPLPETDARLIAAAPDLLAALKRLKWKSTDKDNMEYRCDTTYVVHDLIRAAIAKAEGTS